MVEPLSVNPDGVWSLSDAHRGVAAELGVLPTATPDGVATSHGHIAAGVTSALRAALGDRSTTMTDARAAAEKISELLAQAARAYERGDRQGAEAIRAAADSITRGETPTGPGSGGGALGPMAGRLGQLGQSGQQAAAPMSALAQAFQQLPQQFMQGVQQIAQKVGGAKASGTSAGPAPGIAAAVDDGPSRANDGAVDESREHDAGHTDGHPAPGHENGPVGGVAPGRLGAEAAPLRPEALAPEHVRASGTAMRPT